MSLISRTIAECNKAERIVGITERYIAQIHRHSDLFGYIDLIAIDPVEGIIAIQVCDGGSRLEHLRKIGAEPCREKAMAWLRAGGRIELWSWRKLKLKRGGLRVKWCAKVEEITSESFDEVRKAS